MQCNKIDTRVSVFKSEEYVVVETCGGYGTTPVYLTPIQAFELVVRLTEVIAQCMKRAEDNTRNSIRKEILGG